jgi:pentatricopeptide repeat protein
MLVRSFVEARSFAEAKERFDRMREVVTKLTNDQVRFIIDGFFTNDQLRGSIYLNNQYARLRSFLEAVTGDAFEIAGREIKKIAPPSKRAKAWDDVPL